eukprot:snap_masked-scaffold_5-processed-gene-1.52-mRNA-1 protein AED:1.00 eAED:1.00 QI:0/-1/0/0/-1/1/1/0/613
MSKVSFSTVSEVFASLKVNQARAVLNHSRNESEKVKSELKDLVTNRLNDLLSFSSTVLAFDKSLREFDNLCEKLQTELTTEPKLSSPETHEIVTGTVVDFTSIIYCLFEIDQQLSESNLQKFSSALDNFLRSQTNQLQKEENIDINISTINNLLKQFSARQISKNKLTNEEVEIIGAKHALKQEIPFFLLSKVRKENILPSLQITKFIIKIFSLCSYDGKGEFLLLLKEIVKSSFTRSLSPEILVDYVTILENYFPKISRSELTDLKNVIYPDISAHISMVINLSNLRSLEGKMQDETEHVFKELFLFDLFFEEAFIKRKQQIIQKFLNKFFNNLLSSVRKAVILPVEVDEGVFDSLEKFPGDVFQQSFVEFLVSFAKFIEEYSEESVLVQLNLVFLTKRKILAYNWPSQSFVKNLFNTEMKGVLLKVEKRTLTHVESLMTNYFENYVKLGFFGSTVSASIETNEKANPATLQILFELSQVLKICSHSLKQKTVELVQKRLSESSGQCVADAELIHEFLGMHSGTQPVSPTNELCLLSASTFGFMGLPSSDQQESTDQIEWFEEIGPRFETIPVSVLEKRDKENEHVERKDETKRVFEGFLDQATSLFRTNTG